MRTRIGFTLVELLVVVAIVAALAAIIVPAWKKAHGPTASIVLERQAGNPPSWLGTGRSTLAVDVQINNVKVGSLANGARQTFEFPLEPGQNTLQVVCGASISRVIQFESAPNRTTPFVCKYLDDDDVSGYAITLRPFTQDETMSDAINRITVQSVQYDPQQQSEMIQKYPPSMIRRGDHEVFTYTTLTSEHVEIIDTTTVRSGSGASFDVGLLIPPLEIGIRNLGGGGATTETHGTNTDKYQASEDRRELVVEGNDKPLVIEKWRSYRTGTAQISLDGSVVPVRFRIPLEEFYVCE